CRHKPCWIPFAILGCVRFPERAAVVFAWHFDAHFVHCPQDFAHIERVCAAQQFHLRLLDSVSSERPSRLYANEPLASLLPQLENFERQFGNPHFVTGPDVPLPKMERTSENVPVEHPLNEGRILMRAVGAAGVQAAPGADHENNFSAWKRDFLFVADLDIIEFTERLPGISRNGHNESPSG